MNINTDRGYGVFFTWVLAHTRQRTLYTHIYICTYTVNVRCVYGLKIQGVCEGDARRTDAAPS